MNFCLVFLEDFNEVKNGTYVFDLAGANSINPFQLSQYSSTFPNIPVGSFTTCDITNGGAG